MQVIFRSVLILSGDVAFFSIIIPNSGKMFLVVCAGLRERTVRLISLIFKNMKYYIYAKILINLCLVMSYFVRPFHFKSQVQENNSVC